MNWGFVLGLFRSKENVFLPVAKNRLYIEYKFPSSTSMLMMNPEWLEICMKNAVTGKAIWKVEYSVNTATSIFLEDKRFLAQIQERINGVSSEVLNQIGEKQTKKNVELIESLLLLGGALALVELKSGLAINGLMHPSIQNAICFLTSNKEESENSQISIQERTLLLIGYGLIRYQQEPVQRFTENIRRLN